MNRYGYMYLLFLGIVGGWLGMSLFWMHNVKVDWASKEKVVKLLQQPDGSMSTEAHCIRHRSLTDLTEVFGYGPALLPYFPSDFLYAPPPYLHARGEMR